MRPRRSCLSAILSIEPRESSPTVCNRSDRPQAMRDATLINSASAFHNSIHCSFTFLDTTTIVHEQSEKQDDDNDKTQSAVACCLLSRPKIEDEEERVHTVSLELFVNPTECCFPSASAKSTVHSVIQGHVVRCVLHFHHVVRFHLDRDDV